MEKKNNIAIILIAIGVIALIQKFVNISILSAVIGAILGIYLLYLYKNNKEKWAMPLGVFITYWNISKILTELDIISGVSRIIGLFWFTFAIILLILYFEKKELYLFNIGIILLSIGVSIYAISFKNLIFRGYYIVSSFYITLAIGLFLGYLLSNKNSRFNLYFAIISLLLGLKFLLFREIGITIPLIFIILGVILYLEGKNKKIKKDEVINTKNNSSNDEFKEFKEFKEFDEFNN